MNTILRAGASLSLFAFFLSTAAFAADPPAASPRTLVLANAAEPRRAEDSSGTQANIAFIALEKRPDHSTNQSRNPRPTTGETRLLPPVKHAPPER